MSVQAVAQRQGVGRQVREAFVRDLKKSFSETRTLVVFKTQNVNTRDLNALRQSLRRLHSNLFVVKNSLGSLALKELGWQDLSKLFAGTCGVSPVQGDAAAVAKLLATFSKDHEGFVLQGGVLDGRPVTSQEISTLSRLPSRQVLLSQLAGVLQGPLRNLAYVLQAPLRDLAAVINSLSFKKEKQDGKRDSG